MTEDQSSQPEQPEQLKQPEEHVQDNSSNVSSQITVPVPASQFELRLPNYEGPLDVLLRLIEGQELEITAVSLALVADQFIAHLATLGRRDPQTISHFLVVAAKLILIKSRALLPQVAAPQELEEETDDLVSQLKAYQLFKRASKILKERESLGLRSFSYRHRILHAHNRRACRWTM